MPVLATAAFVLPLMHQPQPYRMPASHERAAMSESGPSSPAERIPKSVWHVQADNVAIHLQSTLTCVPTAGDFERSELDTFDGYGFDVGCNYDRDGGGEITIYLTKRTGRSLADEFTAADAAIKEHWSDVKPVAGAVPSPSGMTFQSAMYARPSGARTGLWVADVSGWTYTIRATYAAGVEAKVMATLGTLTDGVRNTAEKHLAACAAAPPVTRDGKQITDQSRIASLTSAATAAAAKDKPAAVVAENWCAEQSAGDDDAPLLFWRNIALGTDGPADRLTLMTIGPSPTLVSVAADKGTPDTANAYALTAQVGETSSIFAFFAGRPDLATLASIAKGIFLGQQPPIWSFSADPHLLTEPDSSLRPDS